MLVRLGTNQFDDCKHILAFRGQPLLSVGVDSDLQLLITLHLDDEAQPCKITVRDNQVQRGPVTVEVGPKISITCQGHTVLTANLSGGSVELDVDFRPFGLNVFSDTVGLHIGGALLSANAFRGAHVGVNIN